MIDFTVEGAQTILGPVEVRKWQAKGQEAALQGTRLTGVPPEGMTYYDSAIAVLRTIVLFDAYKQAKQ